jgi:hypothetical protein
MLAVALAVAACRAGFSIYFTTLDDLVRRLRAAEATGRFPRQLQAYLRPAVLIVDLCYAVALRASLDLDAHSGVPSWTQRRTKTGQTHPWPPPPLQGDQ